MGGERSWLTIPACLCKPTCLCIRDYLSYTHLNLSRTRSPRSLPDIHTYWATHILRRWGSVDHRQAHNIVRRRRIHSCMCSCTSRRCWCKTRSHRTCGRRWHTRRSPRSSTCRSACSPADIRTRRIRWRSRSSCACYNDVLSRRPSPDTHLYLKFRWTD